MPSGGSAPAASGWLQDVEHAAAVHHHQRRHLLGEAVLEHLEVVGAEIRDELAVGRARNHIERDQVHVDTKRRLCGGWRHWRRAPARR